MLAALLGTFVVQCAKASYAEAVHFLQILPQFWLQEDVPQIICAVMD